MQYGSPTLSTPSTAREQQSMTMNFSTGTPESSSNGYNGYNGYNGHNGHNGHVTEQSPRLNVHSPAMARHAQIPPPPPLLSQLEPTNHMLQYPTMRQAIARPTASPPPPPPPPPPAPALQVRDLILF